MKPRFRVVAVCLLGACFTIEGGSNVNRKAPGNGASGGGVRVGLGDIAVSPDGRFFVSQRDRELMIGASTSCAMSGTAIFEPSRIAFAPDGDVAFVSSVSLQQVVAVRLSSHEVLWRADAAVSSTLPELRVAPGGGRLLLVHARSFDVLDVATGAVTRRSTMPREIVDVDFLGGDDLAVTLVHVWHGQGSTATPETLVELASMTSDGVFEIAVPNCSERLEVSPTAGTAVAAPRLAAFWAKSRAEPAVQLDAPASVRLDVPQPTPRYAFLAPTRCRLDPISVIDLANRTFVTNLPGFGPVTLSPDGSTLVGFYEKALGAEGDPYSLIFVDTSTLRWELVPAGDVMPRYAFTPDGTVLLVDYDAYLGASLGTRLLDVDERRFREMTGPKVDLDQFALTSDSRFAWVVSEGDLYAMDLAAAAVEKRVLPYEVRALNISPDDAVLYLHDAQQNVRLYEPSSRRERCEVLSTWKPQTNTAQAPVP